MPELGIKLSVQLPVLQGGSLPPLLFTATEPLQVFSSLRAKPLLPLPPPVPGQWWLATALILAGYSFPVELQ